MCSRGRTLLTTAVIFAALALAALPARADPTKEQCIEANASAQDLRRDGKLTTARERLQSCAQPACPALVRDDCSRRLDELDKIQPSIVFEVRDAAGKDITAVQSLPADPNAVPTIVVAGCNASYYTSGPGTGGNLGSAAGTSGDPTLPCAGGGGAGWIRVNSQDASPNIDVAAIFSPDSASQAMTVGGLVPVH